MRYKLIIKVNEKQGVPSIFNSKEERNEEIRHFLEKEKKKNKLERDVEFPLFHEDNLIYSIDMQNKHIVIESQKMENNKKEKNISICT